MLSAPLMWQRPSDRSTHRPSSVGPATLHETSPHARRLWRDVFNSGVWVQHLSPSKTSYWCQRQEVCYETDTGVSWSFAIATIWPIKYSAVVGRTQKEKKLGSTAKRWPSPWQEPNSFMQKAAYCCSCWSETLAGVPSISSLPYQLYLLVTIWLGGLKVWWCLWIHGLRIHSFIAVSLVCVYDPSIWEVR